MKLYSAIELGSNSIKIIVASSSDDKFNILAKEEVETTGIKKGIVTNIKRVSDDLNIALNNVEKKLGASIKKIVLCISPVDIIYDMIDGSIETDDELVTGYDISVLVRNACEKNAKKDYEIVTSTPVGFSLDNGNIVDDPKRRKSKTLSSKIVATYMEKDKLYNILNIMQLADLEVVDIVFKPIADYYTVRTKETDDLVGAIINIGEDSTTVSIHNKGIMIKNSFINMGSSHVDHDFTYIYKTDLKESRKLKENFATAYKKYADANDEVEVLNENKEKIKINQEEITEVAEARIEEILKLAKKEIKNLTNRKISYIIILGGLTEIAGFAYIANDVFKENAIVYNSTTTGIRHNKYTSVLGSIKYFKEKLDLREMDFDMFDRDNIDEITSTNTEDNAVIIKELLSDFIN